MRPMYRLRHTCNSCQYLEFGNIAYCYLFNQIGRAHNIYFPINKDQCLRSRIEQWYFENGEYDCECMKCGHTWVEIGEAFECPKCGNPNIDYYPKG